jgi:hypothetical protein
MRISVASTLLVAVGLSDGLAAQRPPTEPFVIRDVCPFECCRLGDWTALGTIPVLTDQRPEASVVFTLRSGDAVTALKGDLRILTLGRAVLRRALAPIYGDSTLRPAIGDTAYVVSLSGESGWYVWHQGVLYSDVFAFWDHRTPLPPDYPATLVSPPHGFWWVQIQNATGLRGWVPAGRVISYGIEGVEPGFTGTSGCS